MGVCIYLYMSSLTAKASFGRTRSQICGLIFHQLEGLIVYSVSSPNGLWIFMMSLTFASLALLRIPLEGRLIGCCRRLRIFIPYQGENDERLVGLRFCSSWEDFTFEFELVRQSKVESIAKTDLDFKADIVIAMTSKSGQLEGTEAAPVRAPFAVVILKLK